MNLTDEQIEEKFEKLPERLREMVFSSDVDEAVFEIAKKHSLNEKNRDFLKGEVLLLLVGVVNTEDFINDIRKEKEINQEIAENIFVDCSTIILDPIMDRFYWREKPKETTEEKIKLTPEEEKEVGKEVEKELEINQALNIKLPKEGLITKNEQLTTNNQQPKNLTEKKPSEVFNLPKEETDYSLSTNTANKYANTMNESANTTNKDTNTANKRDPYRVEPE